MYLWSTFKLIEGLISLPITEIDKVREKMNKWLNKLNSMKETDTVSSEEERDLVLDLVSNKKKIENIYNIKKIKFKINLK
jgi:hypothetical protein